MKSVLLFLLFTFSALNANAQLGDLFRKLGDTIDSVTKQNKLDETRKEENNQNTPDVPSEILPIKENQAPKLDTIQSTNSLKKNSFGIKGIELGGSLPVGFNCVSDRYFDATKRKTCEGKTTILEVPYVATVITIDEKIVFVFLSDDIWGYEWSLSNGRNKPNKDLWDRENKYGKLTVINDYSVYMNDIVKNIIEKIGDPKKLPKIKKEQVKSINGVSATVALGVHQAQTAIKRIENKQNSSKDKQLSNRDKGVLDEKRKLLNNLSLLLNALDSQCKSCKSTIYEFNWDIDDYLIYIKTAMPETKDDPFPFYSSFIKYSYKDFDKTSEKLNAIEKRLEEEEINGINDLNRKLETQKNESRKKDF